MADFDRSKVLHVVTKSCSIHAVSDEAATKLIYLALRNITAKWKNPPREWHVAKARFAIQFGERFVPTG